MNPTPIKQQVYDKLANIWNESHKDIKRFNALIKKNKPFENIETISLRHICTNNISDKNIVRKAIKNKEYFANSTIPYNNIEQLIPKCRDMFNNDSYTASWVYIPNKDEQLLEIEFLYRCLENKLNETKSLDSVKNAVQNCFIVDAYADYTFENLLMLMATTYGVEHDSYIFRKTINRFRDCDDLQNRIYTFDLFDSYCIKYFKNNNEDQYTIIPHWRRIDEKVFWFGRFNPDSAIEFNLNSLICKVCTGNMDGLSGHFFSEGLYKFQGKHGPKLTRIENPTL